MGFAVRSPPIVRPVLIHKAWAAQGPVLGQPGSRWPWKAEALETFSAPHIYLQQLGVGHPARL
eukprot:2467984-Lingulodinium_polyedra.AAC.1